MEKDPVPKFPVPKPARRHILEIRPEVATAPVEAEETSEDKFHPWYTSYAEQEPLSIDNPLTPREIEYIRMCLAKLGAQGTARIKIKGMPDHVVDVPSNDGPEIPVDPNEGW